jgi:hypothetical protein
MDHVQPDHEGLHVLRGPQERQDQAHQHGQYRCNGNQSLPSTAVGRGGVLLDAALAGQCHGCSQEREDGGDDEDDEVVVDGHDVPVTGDVA